MRTSFIVILMLSLLSLVACDMQGRGDREVAGGSPFDPYNNTVVTDGQSIETIQGDGNMLYNRADGQNIMQHMTKGKIAILLPLSGKSSAIGQSLLQSAQLALFDMNQGSIELLPFDTAGTTQGSAAAATQAVQQNASVILGPLFADSVAAAGQVARRQNINVIGFTTDWNKAGGNVLTMGILPFDQGARLAQYAGLTAKRRVVILSPNTPYSQAVISAFEQSTAANNVQIVQKVNIGENPSVVAQTIANLARASSQFDAILMPFADPTLSTVANALNANNLGTSQKLWLGTGIWDDDSVKRNRLMAGAVYAAPSPDLRRNFETNYQAVYGTMPPRIASLSYDATALAITLLSHKGGVAYQDLINPNGYMGIDGIFRFQSNGLAQRGLAMHKISGNGISTIIDQAPKSF